MPARWGNSCGDSATAAIVGMWEREEVGRLGVEFYYTGEKRLEENSFHGTSRPYFIIGALAERQVGRVRVVRERPRRRI
jgi:iron complex outermembrane receptor protein